LKLSPSAAEKLLRSTPDAMVVVDGSGRIVFCNPGAEQLFGYTSDELLGEQIECLMPESARAKHVDYRQKYRGAPHARPLVSGLSLQGRRKNGETFAAEIALTPLDSDGEKLVASTIRDIEAGDTSEAYFRHLLQAAPDSMIIVDENGRIAIANDQSEKMFGYSRDELLGKPIEMLLPEGVRERHVGHRRTFAADPRLRPMGSGMNLLARRADGTEFPVEISLSPVKGASGSFVSSVIRDVTAWRAMESELIAARQAAERAHKANTAFLAAASHDLRQPVQALSLLTGALRRTAKDELILEMVESQQHSLDAMTNLLNSLLDISRLDAGAIEPEIEEFPVQRLIDRLSAEFSRQARQKGLNFHADGCTQMIRSDPNLLGEIIQNFVSNGIRYTNVGEVTLHCHEMGDLLRIAVADTGVGIASDDHEIIFSEFHQLESHGASSEGFGLGLAIVRRLAELLGHEIKVESQPGAGSTFSVNVPLAPSAARQRARPDAMDTADAGLTGKALIMLIEDDRSVAAAWSLLLRSEGYQVVSADSVASAERAAAKLEHAPDLVITDYHLAGNSTGVEAVAMLRQRFSGELPAFIVSGDTSKVVDDARHVANSLLLRKPVNTDELLQRARLAIASGVINAA
jgi:two-component system, sensor histidine kinase